MSIYSLLQSILEPIVPDVVPDSYEGDKPEYIEYSMTDIPVFFGDNEPEFIRHMITIKWYSPKNENPNPKKKQICRAISAAGMTYPTVTDLSDDVGRCFAFETEAVDGDV